MFVIKKATLCTQWFHFVTRNKGVVPKQGGVALCHRYPLGDPNAHRGPNLSGGPNAHRDPTMSPVPVGWSQRCIGTAQLAPVIKWDSYLLWNHSFISGDKVEPLRALGPSKLVPVTSVTLEGPLLLLLNSKFYMIIFLNFSIYKDG